MAIEYQQKDITIFYNGYHGVDIVKKISINVKEGFGGGVYIPTFYRSVGSRELRYNPFKVSYNMVRIDEDFENRHVTIKYYQVDEPASSIEDADTQEDNGTLLRTEMIPFENVISVNTVRKDDDELIMEK
jgi:hypothetical protein